nr:MAG TPA: hypothetical protein [Caudoviricetes sp.]
MTNYENTKHKSSRLQELADEHHERASKLSCVPFCNTDWAVEAGIAAAYDNAIEILKGEMKNETHKDK